MSECSSMSTELSGCATAWSTSTAKAVDTTADLKSWLTSSKYGSLDSLDSSDVSVGIIKPLERVLYAENIMPHLVRAKEEGIRRRIEMDTVVIDRGVAVAQGIDHADMILGLKVKYAKEESLPMDSAFIMFKEKEKGAADAETVETAESRRRSEKGKEGDGEGKEGGAAEEKEARAEEKKSVPGERCAPPFPTQFIVVKNGGEFERLIRIDRIIEVKDEFYTTSGAWRGLKIYYDAGPAVKEIMISEAKEAEFVWKCLAKYSAGT